MNEPLPEMINCLNSLGNSTGIGTDMSLLERQCACVKWQQEQFQQNYLDGNGFSIFPLPAQSQAQQFQSIVNDGDSGLNDYVVAHAVKADPGLDNEWPDFGPFGGEGLGFGSSGLAFDVNYGISRTASCPPLAVAAMAGVAVVEKAVFPEKLTSAVGRESFKKRKADKNENLKEAAEDDTKVKKIKACSEDTGSKITKQNSDTDNKKKKNDKQASADTSKEKSNVSEAPKTDYIHVRARRGQATDSHSLAERVRREKISERMRYLQDLVPGCNRITGKAGMLDEIINYVESLQRQVEFLSMKLAAVNPTLDFNIDNFFAKEVFPMCNSNFPAIGVSPEVTNPGYIQFNPSQVVSCSGMEMGMNAPDMNLRRTTSAPHIQPSSDWDTDLQNLYGVEFLQGRSTSFPCQQFTGPGEVSNLKMEM